MAGVRKWKVILCVVLAAIVLTGAVLSWRYYKNTRVYEQYRGTGRVVEYEETEDGLILTLEVDDEPYWSWVKTGKRVKLLIDNKTAGLFPRLVYAMEQRIVGYELSFTSREFWLPDAMAAEDYIYPALGCVIADLEWFDLIEAGVVNEADYQEFESGWTANQNFDIG